LLRLAKDGQWSLIRDDGASATRMPAGQADANWDDGIATDPLMKMFRPEQSAVLKCAPRVLARFTALITPCWRPGPSVVGWLRLVPTLMLLSVIPGTLVTDPRLGSRTTWAIAEDVTS